MKKPIHIWCELHLASIWFFKGYSKKEYEQYIKKEFNYDCGAKFGQSIHFEDSEKSVFTIWVDENSKTKDFLSGLAHECLHVTNYILSRNGMKIDISNNDEIQCYTLTWIYRSCIERCGFK